MELDEFIELVKEQQGIDLSGVLTTADKIARPQSSLDREAFDDFNTRNPMAGGGMLVQPSADGSRPGYAKKKAGVGYEKRMKVKNYLTNLPKNSNIAVVELANKLNVGRKLIDDILKEKEFKNKNFTLVRRTGSLTDEKFAEEYKKFQKSDFFKTGQDSEFANYLNDAGFKPSAGGDKFTSGNVRSRRNALNIKTASTKGPTLTDKEILKEAKRLNIKNIKNLTSSELRSKVIRARTYETTKKKLEEDPEFKKDFQKKAKKFQKKFKKKRMSTAEGRALLLKQRRKDKQLEYKRKGLDPLATNPDEALWRDSVITANKNVDGKGRFSIESGYSKSMSAKDYYGNKIKIKDNQTGKIFNYNNFKNYVNKNAGSFGLKNYDEAVKSYRQKYFINDKPGLRTSINYALIPNYNEGMTTSAYTIQHDFGRQNNPLKTSLAFYNENLKEYTIRTDFEKAWAASKKSKTPLADRKKAFNVFKKDLANLNIQSVPSMVIRERVFGEGLDLTDILKTAKKEGATLPRGVLKEAAEFDKTLIENTLASFADSPQCEIFIRKRKADGGRIPYETGTASLSRCAQEGAKNFQDGKFKTADQVQDAAKLLSGGRRVLSGLMKYGIIPELAFVGLEATGRSILGEKPLNAIKKSIDTFTFGLTDFTSGIEAEKFGKFGDLKLDVDKYRNSLAKVNSIQQDIANLESLNTGSEFGYEGDQTEAIQIKKAQLEAAKKELQQNMISPDKVSFIDRMADNIADAQMAKSGFAKASLKDQMEGIPGVADYMDTETARVFPKQPSQAELNLNLLPNFRESLKTKEAKMDRVILNAPDEVLQEISPEALELKRGLQEAYKMENLKDVFGAEQIYGTQGSFFGEPLAKGGRAGYKTGSVRKGILKLIDDSVKSTPKDTTSALDKLIKQTLDEDLFDKKDRIIDNLNARIAKAKEKGLDSEEIGKGQIEFYDNIIKSNFRTKTGPFFDYQKRKNKAGGGLLKQAGDRSGAPPESGPNSQGLQGLLNRGKNI